MSINLSKCTDLDYIYFLIAASTVFSCTDASRCSHLLPMLPLMIVLLASFKATFRYRTLLVEVGNSVLLKKVI